MLPADAPAGVPRVPGVTTVPASGLRVAVNVDPAESEPRPLAPDAFLARLGDSPAGPSVAEPAADGAAREAAQSLWWYVVLAMAAVLARRSLARAHHGIVRWHTLNPWPSLRAGR